MLSKVRELQHKGRFAIVSTMVNRHQNPRWIIEKPYAHVYGELKAKVATMSLNRGHKNNLLTPTMIQEVQRFLKSYEIDDMIDLVWCQSSSSEVFSQGTDLRYLLTRVKENKNQEAINYLAQIQNCAKTFATFNKATLTYIRGDVSGSAAAMVGSMAFGLTDETVRWWMNETQYGFVPHGGASYLFSRMPRELGTFLALTGQHLNHEDLITLGLAKYQLDTSQLELGELLSELMIDNSRPGHTNQLYGNMFQEFRQNRIAGHEDYLQKVNHEIQQRIFNKDPDLAEDPRMVMAEVIYRNQMVQKANLDFNLENSKQTVKTQRIQNYLQNFDENIFEILKSKGHFSTPKTLKISCEHPGISRCFSADSIEEIIERLRSEKSEWANNVIENLQARSPLSLKLTLQLIRQAEKSTWVTCLESEYNVMTQLITQKDFSLGVENMSNDTPIKWSKQAKEISNNEVQSFFEDKKLNHGLVENALHPVKDFYVKYPDNVRLFLNEENLYGDLKARSGQEVDIIAFLKNNNLPSDDTTIAVSNIRKIIMNSEEQTRLTHQKVSKLFELCGSVENLRKYQETRQTYIDEQFVNNTQKINQMIETAVDKVFKDKFDERIDAYSHIAQVKLHKDKSDMFSQIRNTLLNKRLTTNQQEYMSPDKWRGTDRMLFFPKDDTVSFLDTYNDSLEDSTLFKKLYAKHTKLEYPKFGNQKQKFYRYILSDYYGKKDDPFDRLSKEYNQLYGDPLQEFNLESYHDQLIKMGGRSKKIQEFINKTGSEQVKQMLKDNQKTTEDEVVKNMESFMELHKLNDVSLQQDILSSQQAIIAEAKQIFETDSFSNKLEQLTQLNQPKDYNLNIGSIRNKLHAFINSDSSLKEIIEPILEEQTPKCLQQLQKKYDLMLSTIYQGKMKSFLHQNKIISFDDKLSHVDSLLSKEIETDLNKLLEPHVFFTFSFLLLKDMAVYYEIFQDISNSVPKSSDNYKSKIAQAMKAKTGLEVDPTELDKFFQFIDQVTHIAITLFAVYRDQIHFTSDVALLQLIQLQQKKAAEENLANSRIKSFYQVVTEKVAESQTGWQKSTLMHYIENQTVGFEPFYSQKEVMQMQKDVKKYPHSFDYQTDVYERRAIRLVNNMKPKLLREFIPGMQHYLMQIDLNTAKASRKDEQITPQFIQEGLEQLEKINEIKIITQNHSITQWFNDTVNSCVQELFNYRRKYELELSTDQLVNFDIEFSKLLEPQNFKATLMQSFNREMDQLGEVAQQVHIAQNKERDVMFQELKASTKQHTPSNNVAMLMAAVNTPLYFDPKVTRLQVMPTKGMIDTEIELPESPYKKGRKSKDRSNLFLKEDLNVRAIKLKQDLIGKLDPVLEGLYEQDILSDKIHNSLKYVYDRIQLKKKTSRLGNRS